MSAPIRSALDALRARHNGERTEDILARCEGERDALPAGRGEALTFPDGSWLVIRPDEYRITYGGVMK